MARNRGGRHPKLDRAITTFVISEEADYHINSICVWTPFHIHRNNVPRRRKGDDGHTLVRYRRGALRKESIC